MKPTGSFFYCHNCNASKKLGDFIKLIDPLLFNDYLKELLSEKYGKPETTPDVDFKTKTEFKPIDDKLSSLKKISQLAQDHPARQYVVNRQIPAKEHYRLYYARQFKSFTNSIIPGKFEKTDRDEPRLLLPFLDQDKKFYGFQGRSFRKNVDPAYRYITIMADEDKPKVFGLDVANLRKDLFVVEGPIDSLFIDNCIATAGGKLQSEIRKLDLDRKPTIIYDNEPRNKEVIANIEQSIEEGYPVVIWPESQTLKDINLMVLDGLKDVNGYLTDHTYSGLRAKLELQRWRKN